jgi:flagella basal body P-ring formation protein FlgA
LTLNKFKNGFMAIQLLFGGWVAICFFSNPACASDVAKQVRLPVSFDFSNEVEVSGDRVQLLDAATCSGRQEICEEAYGVDLGAAPNPGKIKFISRNEIKKMLKSEWPDAEVEINGGQTLRIKAKFVKLTKEIVREALEETLLSKMAGIDRVKVLIKKLQMTSAILVRPGEFNIRFPVFESISNQGSVDYLAKSLGGHQNLEVVYGDVDSGYEKSFNVGASLELSMLLPVASHNIVRGSLLKGQDFAMAWVKLGNGKRKYVTNIKDLRGFKAKRGVSVGEAVKSNQIMRPHVISRGQVVKLNMSKNGIEVTGQIRALENGGHGEFITAEYLKTKKHIRVRIRDSKSVDYTF